MSSQVTASVVVLAAALVTVAGTQGLLPDVAVLFGLEGCVMFFLFKGFTSNTLRPWTRRSGGGVFIAFVAIGVLVGAVTGAGAWYSLKNKTDKAVPDSLLRAQAEDFARTIAHLTRYYRELGIQQDGRHLTEIATAQTDSAKSALQNRHVIENRDLRSNYVHDFISNHAETGRNLLERISDRLKTVKTPIPPEGRVLAIKVFRGKEVEPDSVLQAADYLEKLSQRL